LDKGDEREHHHQSVDQNKEEKVDRLVSPSLLVSYKGVELNCPDQQLKDPPMQPQGGNTGQRGRRWVQQIRAATHHVRSTHVCERALACSLCRISVANICREASQKSRVFRKAKKELVKVAWKRPYRVVVVGTLTHPTSVIVCDIMMTLAASWCSVWRQTNRPSRRIIVREAAVLTLQKQTANAVRQIRKRAELDNQEVLGSSWCLCTTDLGISTTG